MEGTQWRGLAPSPSGLVALLPWVCVEHLPSHAYSGDSIQALLTPCDIVSQRESKSTSQKNENSKDIQEPLLQAALPSPSLPTVSGFAKMGGGQCQLAHPPEPKWLSPAACSFCPSVVLLPYLQKSKSTFTTVSPKGKEFL